MITLLTIYFYLGLIFGSIHTAILLAFMHDSDTKTTKREQIKFIFMTGLITFLIWPKTLYSLYKSF